MSIYHKTLRVSGVVLALVLLFDSGLLSPVTKEFSESAQFHVAQVVGVSAGVAETELNQITADLTARERELDAREAALRTREIDARAVDTSGVGTNYTTYILSTILFILLVLIVLNYVLDWIRSSRPNVRYETQPTP